MPTTSFPCLAAYSEKAPEPLPASSVRTPPRRRRGRLARLVERDEDLPLERTKVLHAPELLEEAGRYALRPLGEQPYARVAAAAMRLYGRRAGRELRRVAGQAALFHVRCGYGHASIDEARRQGMFVLCGHTIVHPSVSEALVERQGRTDDLGCLL